MVQLRRQRCSPTASLPSHYWEPLVNPPGPAQEDDLLGLGRPSGDHHYRAFVGPPEDYDLIGALQFTALIALGMRDLHVVADVGCGSLRAGRLLIPYLQRGHYFGLEPEEWLVRAGLESELGTGITAVKRPSFAYRADFDLSCFQTKFDFIIAHSIFSHTYADLAQPSLVKLASALQSSGYLLVTFVDDVQFPHSDEGTGWEYPGCVRYRWPEFRRLLGAAGLTGVRFAWPHPRQTWVVAGRNGNLTLRKSVTLARWYLGSSWHHPLAVTLRRHGRDLAARARRGR